MGKGKSSGKGKAKVKVKVKTEGGKHPRIEKLYKPRVRLIASIHKEREK